jgi:2-haloacid dehalogenase
MRVTIPFKDGQGSTIAGEGNSRPVNRFNTVIFDMYETLVENDHSNWRVTFQDIIKEQNLEVSVDRLWEEWHLLERSFRSRRLKPGAPFETYCDAWYACFVRAFASLELNGDPIAAVRKSVHDISCRPPYEETLEAIKLVQRRWKTAVLSNADNAYLIPNLEGLGLKFDEVLSSEEARSYKPQPDSFREILRRLGTHAQGAVYVGDRQFEDVKGASQVGMTTIWINRSGSPLDFLLPVPDFQISDLLELPRLLSQES